MTLHALLGHASLCELRSAREVKRAKCAVVCRDQGMLPHVLSPCQRNKREGVRHVGKVRLEDLEVGDRAKSIWLVDRLLVQEQVCEEACHRLVPGKGLASV